MIHTIRVLSGAALLVSFASGCSSAEPADGNVDVVSENGSIEAHVRFEGGVRRGANTFRVRLESLSSAIFTPILTHVDALMPGHLHSSQTEEISYADQEFQVSKLELNMSGRWELELGVSSLTTSDTVKFPVDVP